MMTKMNLKFDTLTQLTNTESPDLFHRIYITVHADDKPAGFVRILYIGSDIAKVKLKNSVDFFVYKIYHDNEELHNAYKENNLEFLCKHLKSFNRNQTGNLKQDWETIQQNIKEDYQNKFEEFVDYWVDKPSRELIYVIDEKTKFFGIINGDEEVKTPIQTENWQGHGIGKELSEYSIKHIDQMNLNLWASSNQTKQGLKLWKFSAPGFEILHAPSKTSYFKDQRAFAKAQ